MPRPNATHALNAIGHFDVAGPDLEQLGRFYASVFGWQAQPKGPGYALLTMPEGCPGGALVEDDQPSLTIGVVVGDLEKVLVQATEAGGRVVMPKVDNGWVRKAQISDPAGNRVTVIEG